MRINYFLIKAFVLRTHGAAAVEFALLFPVFVAVIMGGYDLARYIFLQNELTVAVQEAGRFAMTRGNSSPNPVDPGLVSQFVSDSLQFNEPNDVIISVQFSPDNSPGSEITINARTNFSALGGLVSIDALQIDSTSNNIFMK